MNAWIDRLVDLGLTIDAECWAYHSNCMLETQSCVGEKYGDGYGNSWIAGDGNGCGAGYRMRGRTAFGCGDPGLADGNGCGLGWAVGILRPQLGYQ